MRCLTKLEFFKCCSNIHYSDLITAPDYIANNKIFDDIVDTIRKNEPISTDFSFRTFEFCPFQKGGQKFWALDFNNVVQ